MKDLGCITNEEVLGQLLELDGKDVVDIGCGNLTFTKILAKLGASVLAIDPDAVQAKLNRDADPVPGIRFVESGGENIPAEDESLDGAFFSYSLHHVPSELYPVVFREVMRVLKPNGFLYVIEPIDCPLNTVMRLFHDEEQERADAWSALESLTHSFETSETVTYHGFTQYESWDAFADHYSNRSFNALYTSDDVRRPEVEKEFEIQGGSDHRFASPKRVMVLKNKIANR